LNSGQRGEAPTPDKVSAIYFAKRSNSQHLLIQTGGLKIRAPILRRPLKKFSRKWTDWTQLVSGISDHPIDRASQLKHED
jgi:hypothetical protein